jgi:hypothetical protein
MSRRSVAGLAAALTGLTLAGAASTAPPEPQTISVLAVGTWSLELDTTEATPTKVGDRFAFGGALYAWAGSKRGNRIGRFEVFSTRTAPNTNSSTATLTLPAGRLFVVGASPEVGPPGPEQLAVVGGTKDYAGVRGTVTVRDLGREDSNRSALLIRLG